MLFTECSAEGFPVCVLGFGGPGGDQKSRRWCPQVSTKRSRVATRLDPSRVAIIVMTVAFGVSCSSRIEVSTVFEIGSLGFAI